MTIASEITRLQNDKAAICTAIENKGVTVGAVTLDSYASCIDAIPAGGGHKTVCYLMMGGGGGGGATDTCGCPGGGGGAGGVKIGTFAFDENICVTVGSGGTGGTLNNRGNTGGNSCMTDTGNASNIIIAHGGGGGGTGLRCNCNGAGVGGDGGSGGGSGGGCYGVTTCYISGGNNPYIAEGELSSPGGAFLGICNTICNVATGGGGASSTGMGNWTFCCSSKGCLFSTARGGKGIEGTFGGKTVCYAGGGGGGIMPTNITCAGCGRSGGGNGGLNKSNGCNGCAATTCGSGGGGATSYTSQKGTGGSGGGGLVIIGYNCACKDCNGFTCATGGNSCYVCDNMKYHCFTSNGTFTIVS